MVEFITTQRGVLTEPIYPEAVNMVSLLQGESTWLSPFFSLFYSRLFSFSLGLGGSGVT